MANKTIIGVGEYTIKEIYDGKAGVGVQNIRYYYQISNDDKNPPTYWPVECIFVDDTTALQPSTDVLLETASQVIPTKENPYLWAYQEIVYTDGTITKTDPQIVGVRGENGTSVTVSAIKYQAGVSATDHPTGTWSATPVAVPEGQYLWTWTHYSDGKDAYSVARQGKNGNDGRGIKTIQDYYLASPKTSGITTSTDGWDTDPEKQKVSEDKKYLWHYTMTTYSDGSHSESTPTVIGVFGQDGQPGKSIDQITVQYAVSTSSTDAPADSEFRDTPPTTDELNGKNQWYRYVYHYSDKTTSYSAKMCDVEFNNLKFLVDQNAQAIEARVTTDKFTTVVGEDGSKITQMSSDLSKAKTDISGLQTEVSSQKTQIESKADGSTVSSMQKDISTLQQTDKEIKTSVMSANAKIDNMKIGGRNLVLNSEDISADGRGSADGSKKEYQAINVGQSYMDVPDDTEVTISFDLQLDVKTSPVSLQIYNSNNKGPKTIDDRTLKFDNAVNTSIIQRVSVITNIKDRAQTDIKIQDNYLEFYTTYGTSNFFKISRIKVEIGNKATDWSPSPEDSKNYTDSKTSEINQKASQISARVKTNEDAIASLKVTDQSITTTVNSSVKEVYDEYCQNQSTTAAPASDYSGWSKGVPAWKNGYYIWKRTITVPNVGDNVVSTPVCLSGAKGDTGTSYSRTVIYYQMNDSDTEAPLPLPTAANKGSWVTFDQLPEWTQGKYVWETHEISKSNGDKIYTTPTCSSGRMANKLHTQIDQNSDHIAMVVDNSATDSSSKLVLTQDAIDAISPRVTIMGADGTTTAISGGKIQTDAVIIGESNVKDLSQDLSDAKQAVNKYITDIDGGGISVHDANSQDNAVHITSTDMTVIQGGKKIAKFGSSVELGTSANAFGKSSFSLGEAYAFGDRSHSEGRNTFAFGDYSTNFATGEKGDIGGAIPEAGIIGIKQKIAYAPSLNVGPQVYRVDYSVDSSIQFSPSLNFQDICLYDVVYLSNNSQGCYMYVVTIDYNEKTLSCSGRELVDHATKLQIASSSVTVGRASFNSGENNKVIGRNSFSEGEENYIKGSYSHAQGYRVRISGDYSHAQGAFAQANNMFSHAQGLMVYANGMYSHSEGGTDVVFVKLTGDAQSQEYTYTVNNNDFITKGLSTAPLVGMELRTINGQSTIARIISVDHSNNKITLDQSISSDSIKDKQYVLRKLAGADGDYAHSQGRDASANGNYSHAQGYHTQANGEASNASGYNVRASSKFQHAFGCANIENDDHVFVELVGNGSPIHPNVREISNLQVTTHDYQYLIVNSDDTVIQDFPKNYTNDIARSKGDWVENLPDAQSGKCAIERVECILQNGSSVYYPDTRKYFQESNGSWAVLTSTEDVEGSGSSPIYDSGLMDPIKVKSHYQQYLLTDYSVAAHVYALPADYEQDNLNWVSQQPPVQQGKILVERETYIYDNGTSSHIVHNDEFWDVNSETNEWTLMLVAEESDRSYSSGLEDNNTSTVETPTIGKIQAENLSGADPEDPTGSKTIAYSNARTLDWNGNEWLAGKLTVGKPPTNDMDVTTKRYVDTTVKNALLDMVYPVGSYYWSSESKSPQEFLGGTWEQIKDKFVYAAGTKNVGDAGGEQTHILTASEMPSHSHSIPQLSGSAASAGSHNHSASASSSGAHTHSLYSPGKSYAAGAKYWGATKYDNAHAQTFGTNSAGEHSHTITVKSDGAHTHTVTTNASNTGANGSGSAHNNMPPYIVAYCWHRTA